MSFSNALIILITFSFFVCLTISMSIIYSIYYFIDLNHKLNKSRKKLVFREKYQRFKNTKTNIPPEYDINIQLSQHTIYIRRLLLIALINSFFPKQKDRDIKLGVNIQSYYRFSNIVCLHLIDKYMHYILI
jgi:hypothetical protein